MDVFNEIKSLVSRSTSIVSQKTRCQKIELYSEGLKSKIKQAQFSLENICNLKDQSDQTLSSTAHEDFTISEKVGFFCDSYWTFLYSSLDVLAQIINQALKLSLKEKDVSFKAVENHLFQIRGNSDVQKKFTACKKSYVFKSLDAYRNCSTHRRQIYIKEEIKIVKHTAGYITTSTGQIESVERTMCDNPLDLTPRTDRRRKLPKYMEETDKKIIEHIAKILKSTNPVN